MIDLIHAVAFVVVIQFQAWKHAKELWPSLALGDSPEWEPQSSQKICKAIAGHCCLSSSLAAHSSALAACRFAQAILGTNAAGALGSLSGPCDSTFALPDLGKPTVGTNHNKSSPFVSCCTAALVILMELLHGFA